MKIYTIGFTKKSAREFFTLVKDSGASRLVDVRLNNSSQLAGFTKKEDLQFFLSSICGMDYQHFPELAPTQEMLDAYKSKQIDWLAYETQFRALLTSRKTEESVAREALDNAILLCSEPKPDKCHRRIVAEYLRDKYGDLEIVHL